MNVSPHQITIMKPAPARLLFLSIASSDIFVSYAFTSPRRCTVPSTSSSPSTQHHYVVCLSAKKTSKSKSTAGGFGAASSTRKSKPKRDKDAIFYPDLEPQVRQTLVPSPIDGTNEDLGGVLSEEMYDRLEEIYGLETFNFGGEGAIFKSIGVGSEDDTDGEKSGASDGSGSLFDDILSGGSSSSSTVDALDGLFGVPSTPVSRATTKSSTTDGPAYDLNNISPFTKFRVLHTDPMVLAIDDFLTSEECDKYVQISKDAEEKQQQTTMQKELNKEEIKQSLQPMLLGQSRTVGKDSRSQAQRTSTTWFHYYEGVPELMAKASRLLGLKDIQRWEEPQTVRYRRNEKFTWHLDALSPEEANNLSGAGQREATLLVYLTDLPTENGGATMFRDLGGGDGSEPLKV